VNVVAKALDPRVVEGLRGREHRNRRRFGFDLANGVRVDDEPHGLAARGRV
jgi:hypothetical protein